MHTTIDGRRVLSGPAPVTHVVKRHGSLMFAGSSVEAHTRAENWNEQYQTDEYTVEVWDHGR